MNNILNKNFIFLGLFFYISLFFNLKTVGAAPSLFYNPGETLMPNCAPGVCTVRILPDQIGHNGHILQTDGNGVLSWVIPPSAPVTSIFGRIGDVVAQLGDYNTDLVTEGTNKYFTEGRVLNTLLTGFTPGAGIVSSSDSIIQALQKLQGTNTVQDTNIATLQTQSHSPLTLNVSNGLSLVSQTLSLGLASSTSNGALSSTDWNTFNQKVAQTRSIATGNGLQGGGNLSADRTISIMSPTCTGTQKLSWNGTSFVCLTDIDTVLSETQVDTYVGNNGYLTSEVDGSITNETIVGANSSFNPTSNVLTINEAGVNYTFDLSTLNNTGTDDQQLTAATLTGTNLTITLEDGGQTTVDLTSLVNDADASITNELNNSFTLSGNNLSITDAGGTKTVDLTPFLDNTDVLASLSCSSNQIAKWNGTSWACANDVAPVTSIFGRIGDVVAQLGDYNTDLVTEGTNKYFTEGRVLNTLLTGFTPGAGIVSSSDSIIQALQKLQGTNTVQDTNIATLQTQSHSPLTLNVSNGLSLVSQTLSLGLASSTSNGALSSTDWNTFNQKVAQTRSIATGNGLQGGGNLSADRTISIMSPTCTGTQKLSWNGTSFVCLTDIDTVLSETQVDTYVGNNGYLTSEVDGSITNETIVGANSSFNPTSNVLTINEAGVNYTFDLSTLNNTGTDDQQLTAATLTGTNLTITLEDGGQTTVDLTSLVNDADASITNELNNSFTLSGNNLSITDAGGTKTVDLTPFLDNTDVLASLSCSSNQIAKWNGTSWACANDVAPVTSIFGRIGDVVAQLGDYNTDLVTEGTNKYFTEGRVLNTLLTGFTPGAGIVSSSDSIIQALQKLQGTNTVQDTNIATLQTQSHSPLTLNVSNGLSLVSQTLSLGLASSTSNGALSSTDWNTFNQKVAQTRSIATGNGLQGGGNLSADRTISIMSPTCTGTQKLSWNGTSFVCLTDIDTVLSETQVDTYVGNNGYLTSEVDGSITNETIVGANSSFNPTSNVLTINEAGVNYTFDLSTLNNTGTDDQQLTAATLTGTNLTITLEDGGQTTVDLTSLVNDADASITNELNNSFTLSGNNLSITDAGGTKTVDLTPFLDNTDVLASLSCSSNQIAKWNGTSWACANDVAPVTSIFGRIGDVVAQLGDYNTDLVTEGTNKYFTEGRVLNTLLTGFTPGAGIVSSSDSIIQALQKLQGTNTVQDTNIATLQTQSHSPLTLNVSNGLSLVSQTLSLGLASSTSNGALSSTDWNTFNQKVAQTRSIATGNGLQGGGNLSADRTISIMSPTCTGTQKLSWNGTSFVCLTDIDTVLSETQVDTYVGNNGYLTSEVDGSITNETIVGANSSFNPTSNVLTINEAGVNYTFDLSTLNNTGTDDQQLTAATLTGTNLTITLEDGGQTTVDLTSLVNDADASITNELNNSFTLSGNNLSITDAGGTKTVDLTPFLDNTDVLASLSCSSNQIAKWNGTSWACANDVAPVTSIFGRIGDVVAQLGDYNTDLVTEGTNKYFTEGRVLNTLLTGFTPGAGIVSSSDSIIQALQKLQGTNTVQDTNIATLQTQSHSPLTLNVSNGLSLVSQTLSLGLASSTSNGALSSTDWNTFNQKVAQTRSIATGNGLQGGGNLSADRTISIMSPTCTGTQKLSWNGTSFVCLTDIDTVLSETQVDTYVGNNGYLTSEVDGSITNETIVGANSSFNPTSNVLTINEAGVNYTFDLSTLNNTGTDDQQLTAATLTGTNLTITLEDGGQTTVDLTSLVNDADASITNELNNSFTLSGNNLSITDAGGTKTVDLTPFLDNTDVLASLSCSSNQIAKWNGTSWACANDVAPVTSIFGRIGDVVAQLGDYNTDLVTEGTNKYFTEGRVLNTLLTGFTPGAGIVSSSDSIIQALQKLQGTNTVQDTNIATLQTQSHSPLTLNVSNGLSLVSQTLSLGLASSTSNGALSSTDWNTFNQKVAQTRSIATGNGLQGGGNLSADRTISIMSPTCTGTQKLSWNGTSFVCLTDIDTVLSETQVDTYVGNNGYLTSEVDGSITNETIVGANSSFNPTSNVLTINEAGVNYTFDLSTLNNTGTDDQQLTAATLTGTNLTITLEDGGQTTVDLTSLVNDADASITNELNNSFTLSGNNLSITDAGGTKTVDLTPFLDNTDVLASLSCSSNQIAKWNGTSWACANDVAPVTSIFGRIGDVVAQLGDYNTDLVTEGTNKYFTEGRVLNTLLTGFTPGAGIVSSSDSIIQALQKLQGTNTVQDTNIATLQTQSHSPLTLNVSNGLSLVSQTLSLGLASSTSNGALSSTDWNTFNQKVAQTRSIATGNGLQGGGNLSADRTISIMSPTCTGTQKLSWNGTSFVCLTDIDTVLSETQVDTYVGNNGYLTSEQNFAEDDLLATGDRSHDFNGFDLSIDKINNATFNSNRSFNINAGRNILFRTAGDVIEFDPGGAGTYLVSGIDLNNSVNNLLVRDASGRILRRDASSLIDVITSGTTSTISSNSGLELNADGLSLLRGCPDGFILKWDGIGQSWKCSADEDTNTTYSNGNGLNLSTTTFSINAPTCTATQKLSWNGNAFVCSTDTGVTTLGTPTGSNANGGSISGTTLTLSLADGTNPGLVSTGTQTFAGNKTFNNSLYINGDTQIGSTSETILNIIGSDVFIPNNLSIDTNTLFINSLTNNVGIGTGTPQATLHNAGSTILGAVTISNLPTGGAIGTATATVDAYTTFNVNQTTTGQTLTLPSPTNTTAGRIAYVNNVGSVEFTMSNEKVQIGKGRQYVWNGTAWSQVGDATGERMISKIKSANQTKTATTALTPDSELQFNVDANETWYFIFDIQANASTAGDLKISVTAPAGSTCSIGFSDAEGATSQDNLGCGVASQLIPGNALADKYIISGTVTAGGTSGTIALNWAQFVASGNLIMYRGASVVAYRIGGADLAEVYYTDDNSISNGDIVALTSTGVSQVKKTSIPYQTSTLGIISTKPGLVIGETDGTGKPVIVGLSGRVPVKVSNLNGAIKPGDYITTSSISGVGMKATDPGFVIGKALTALTESTEQGEVIVFVQNSYFDGQYDIFEEGVVLPGNENLESSDSRTILENGSIADRLTHLVRRALEKLSMIFIDMKAWFRELKTERIETKELCVEDICVTRDQFLQMIQNSGGSYTQVSNNSNSTTESNNENQNSSEGNTSVESESDIQIEGDTDLADESLDSSVGNNDQEMQQDVPLNIDNNPTSNEQDSPEEDVSTEVSTTQGENGEISDVENNQTES